MSQQSGTETPLKIGIAGLGFGATEFLPSLEQMPQIKIVGGADTRPQALQAFQKRYEGSRTYDTVAELCADPDVEAIWIATPNQFHGEHALLAAQHGKHSVVRKPLATTIDECERIVETAEKNNVKILGGGQTQGTNALIQEVRRMIVRGDLGPLRAINLWAFTGWMLRPRMAQEVDDDLGGGIVWRQAPHQLETIRWLGGGKVRSVRAITGRWRPERPRGTGYFTALLEFEDGTPATIVYNAYGYFDSVELVKWGNDKGIDERAKMRQQLLTGEMDEPTLKEATRFGGMVPGDDEPKIPWEAGRAVVSSGGNWLPGNQGVFVISLQDGDVRAAPNGLYVHDNNGTREVPIASKRGEGMAFMDEEAMELIDAVRHGKPMLHDARWGMATAEVQWAILESGKQHKEIALKHQTAVPAGF
jgi:phthalate 4,5-cis-dihydrodiol dehydrogenase